MGRLLRKLVAALGLLLALSPVFVVVGWLGLPGAVAHWALWPLVAVSLAVMIGLARGRLRAVLGVAGLLGLLAAMAVWGPGGGWPMLAVPAAIVYWLVVSTGSRPPFEEWRVSIWAMGAAAHMAGFLVARGFSLPDAVPVLRALALCYVPVFLLMLNRLMLEESASAKDGTRPPRRIRSGNRWLVAGISVAALAVANLRALRDAFYACGNWLLAVVGSFIAWLSGLFLSEAPSAGGGQESGLDMLMEEVAEPSAFWLILEKVGMVFALLIAAVLLVLAGAKLYKVARAMLARLVKRMRGMMAQLSEGVQEKTESILDWDEAREAARRGVRRVRGLFTRPPRWQDMDNRQRVRWAYGQTVCADTPPGCTARESLADRPDGMQMADIYDTARYSDQPVTDEQAAFMRDALRRQP